MERNILKKVEINYLTYIKGFDMNLIPIVSEKCSMESLELYDILENMVWGLPMGIPNLFTINDVFIMITRI